MGSFYCIIYKPVYTKGGELDIGHNNPGSCRRLARLQKGTMDLSGKNRFKLQVILTDLPPIYCVFFTLVFVTVTYEYIDWLVLPYIASVCQLGTKRRLLSLPKWGDHVQRLSFRKGLVNDSDMGKQEYFMFNTFLNPLYISKRSKSTDV